MSHRNIVRILTELHPDAVQALATRPMPGNKMKSRRVFVLISMTSGKNERVEEALLLSAGKDRILHLREEVASDRLFGSSGFNHPTITVVDTENAERLLSSFGEPDFVFEQICKTINDECCEIIILLAQIAKALN